MSASWSRPQSNTSATREGRSDGRRLSGAGLNALSGTGLNTRSGYSMPGASLSRCGADVLKSDARRPNLLSPSMLLAKTHGANFSSGKRPQRGTTASSLWSIPSSVEASERSGTANTSSPQPGRDRRGSSATPTNRLYMTAPGKMQIGAGDVEQATGVRLSGDQLEALRKRYQGGYARLGAEPRFGESINNDDLRQEVFGSIVLRPGQWPKLGGSTAASSRQVRSPSLPSPASMHGRSGYHRS